MDGRQTSCELRNELVSSLRRLLRDEEVTAVQHPSVKRKHGLSTQNACSALHAPAPAARATSPDLALATEQERNGMTRGHVASTPDRILRSD